MMLTGTGVSELLLRQNDSTLRNNHQLTIAAIVSGLGGLLFGYDNIVISGAIHSLSVYFHLDAAGVGWAAGCALIGCIAGTLAAGIVVDRLGHKKALWLAAVCFALSSAGIWFANSFSTFVLSRLVGGLGIGAASIISPMYIAEIAPARSRGRLVALYQVGIVTGILAAVFINMLIQRMGSEAWNITVGWRLMFLVGIAPALLFGCMIFPAPESARWLIKMGRRGEALRVLCRLNPTSAVAEMSEIEISLAEESGHLSELFTAFLRPLLIGIMLAGLSQASGITPIFSFLPDVFRAAGSRMGDAFFQSVLVSTVNLCFTLVALWLVDVSGRKKLLIAGTLIQFFSLACVGWFYRVHANLLGVLVFIMTFVVGHAVGNGVVCWVIISEIYPTKARGRAMAIATTALWVVAFLGNQTYPLMQKKFGSAVTFWCFAMAALVNCVCVAVWVLETKGRSLEEISRRWHLTSPQRAIMTTSAEVESLSSRPNDGGVQRYKKGGK